MWDVILQHITFVVPILLELKVMSLYTFPGTSIQGVMLLLGDNSSCKQHVLVWAADLH